jgi:hypothetical protein
MQQIQQARQNVLAISSFSREEHSTISTVTVEDHKEARDQIYKQAQTTNQLDHVCYDITYYL